MEYALDPDLRGGEPGPVSAVVVQPPAASPPAGKEPPASTTAERKGVGRGIASLEVEKWLRAWIDRRLAVTADRIDPSKPFADFGIDSVTAVELNAALAEWLQTPLPATVCWDFPNIRALAGSIVPSLSAAKAPPPAATSRAPRDLDELSQTELAALLAAELKTLR